MRISITTDITSKKVKFTFLPHSPACSSRAGATEARSGVALKVILPALMNRMNRCCSYCGIGGNTSSPDE